MRSPSDARRICELKRRQAASALTHARELASQRQARLDEARLLREHSQQALVDAMPMEEQGLSRRSLYDRLRTLAVARAHALESGHHATSLEVAAAECHEAERMQRHRAVVHEGKRRKIDEWLRRTMRERMLRFERRNEQEVQEEYACRHR
jgi:hypothetical protein